MRNLTPKLQDLHKLIQPFRILARRPTGLGDRFPDVRNHPGKLHLAVQPGAQIPHVKVRGRSGFEWRCGQLAQIP
jgi:hypothetical protein